MKYDYSGLGEKRFQSLCQVLASEVLGESFHAFGDGKDGGRDGTFRSPAAYPPDEEDAWAGYGVFQVKYMNGSSDTKTGTSWLLRQIKNELEEWLAPDKDRVLYGQLPEYLIFATNVSLSAVPGKGGHAKVDELIGRYLKRLPLKGWRVWDYTQICTYVSASESVRDAFGLSTQGDVLAALNRQLNRNPRPGEGVPWCSGTFQEAFDASGGDDILGSAIDVAHPYGPGYVQHFYNGHTAKRYVICCLGNGPALALGSQLWDALCRIGNQQTANAGPELAGFPQYVNGAAEYLDPLTASIPLHGGMWGPGSMTRVGSEVWRWQPTFAMSFNASRDRTTWTSGRNQMDLRLRMVARAQIASASPAIDKSGRQRLQRTLTANSFAGFASRWAAKRGLEVPLPQWELAMEPEGRNDSTTACYQFTIPGQQGVPAIIGLACLAIPHEPNASLLMLVDFRVAFNSVIPATQHTFPIQIPDKLRVTVADLHSFFCISWPLLGQLLCAVAEDPRSVLSDGPSSLEFHVSSERTDATTNSRYIRLDNVLDLTAFGASTRSLPNDVSVGIDAAVTPAPDNLPEVSTRMLMHLAGGYGFIDADATELCARIDAGEPWIRAGP